ncbi:putative Transporter of MFS family, contains Lipocalin domain [Nitrospira sp. KM1]|uniref:MFS transporter n=1 Tax=Nitrospira sp. KM1 TaxID=1936990 RepID=UPI0013A71D93|nr:MFS transporter [Nitrospira sp. KM1]BCA56379.1 putative Transporter of MFS family, contains Lipocalin domain [Nitrospira sp. KM1]
MDIKETAGEAGHFGATPESVTVPAHHDLAQLTRRYGFRDGACQAITQGCGEQYLSAFALLLHAGSFQLSILSALPQLVGTAAQIASIKLLQWFPDRTALIRAGTIGQAVSWLPIVMLPLLFPEIGGWLLIAGASLYFACNHFTTPTWNSFIADHLDEHARGAYFARRAQIIASISFLALCAAGGLLSLWQHIPAAWVGFVFIFLVAGAARIASLFALSRIPRTHPTPHGEGRRGFRSFLAETSPNYRRFLLFSGLMHMSVMVAGPFFVVYMLRDLHLSYFNYGTWLAAGILGQLVSLQAWGRIGDRFGNKALLSVTGLMVPFLPMMYLISTDTSFLCMVNFFGGVTWGGLALGLQNYVFDAARSEDRGKAVAVYSTINASGWMVGALAGSLLVETLPARMEAELFSFQLVSNLPLVFLLSGIFRLGVSAGLLNSFGEARRTERFRRRHLVRELPFLKTISHFLIGPASRTEK